MTNAKHIRFTRRRVGRSVIRLLLALLALLMLLPVIVTFLYSFFSPDEIKTFLAARGSMAESSWMDIRLIPSMFSIGQYYQLLISDTAILQRFLLSVFYTVAILIGQAAVLPMMAYALSRFEFRGRGFLFFLLLILMLLPFQVTMVPNVLILRSLNLLNTVWAVILPLWFSPFYIFLLRQFMVGLPDDLYEAAQLDGAGTFHCYVNITLPVCRPVIGAAIALSFADSWNMVEQPMVFLSKRDDLQPLSVVFNQLIDTPQGVEFAGAVLFILPALFIYLYFLEDIVSGIQLTELK